MKNQQAGFSIVELVLATAIAGIISIVMMTISVNLFGDTLRAQATAEMAMQSQLILTQLVDDIRLSDGISAVNSINDPNGPNGGWVTNDPSNIIIIKSPAVDSSRNIIYNDSTGDPYANEAIYFSSNNTMFRRSLRNDEAAGNTTLTTCPQANANSTCPSDKEFTKYLQNLTFTFYDVNDSSVSDPALASSVNLTVNMRRTVYGVPVTFSNTTRTTLRNY